MNLTTLLFVYRRFFSCNFSSRFYLKNTVLIILFRLVNRVSFICASIT